MLTEAENREIVCDGRAPPSGWRRDNFGSSGFIGRSVWTPPWRLRSPFLEPEQWLSLNQKHTNDARENWKMKDPDGFAAQERRRADYQKLKQTGKVGKVLAAHGVPLLSCKGSPPTFGTTGCIAAPALSKTDRL